MTWVALTLFAALMQSVRTAGQKSLASTVSPMAATLVRYLFGLPFAIGYLLVIIWLQPADIVSDIEVTPRFFTYAGVAAILQIVATASLIQVFSTRNFAVGTAYAKTEALMTGILAVLLFQESLSLAAWASVIGGVTGVLFMSVASIPTRTELSRMDNSAAFGLLSGLCFALTSLFLRQASLSLHGPAFLTAAVTLVFMVSLQSAITAVWIVCRDRRQFGKIWQRRGVSLFIGITSVLGSIGWFTAMTLQHPAYVKALGQVEVLITVLITGRIFQEFITRRESVGMLLIVGSVCLLLLDL